MSTKSRQTIWGGTIMGAKISARHAREEAQKAPREADRAEAYAWSVQMEGYGGPAQPSPTVGQCLNGGLGWLEVECNRCKTRASLPLDAIRRSLDYAGALSQITQNGHFHLFQMANPVDCRQQSCSFDARGRRVRLTICESPGLYDSRSRDLAWAPGECPKRFWNCLAKFV
jgi:hypothetical protein